MKRWYIYCVVFIISVILGWSLEHLIRPKQEFSFNQLLMLNDQSNELINQQLSNLINALPQVARVRVGLFHGPGRITRLNYRDFQFDVVNLKSAQGKDPGPTLTDQSLGQWDDFIAPMFDGKCIVANVKDLTSPESINRLKALHASSFIGCPINNHRGDLIGGLFAIWDTTALPEPLSDAESLLRSAAPKIYSAIEIRLQASERF